MGSELYKPNPTYDALQRKFIAFTESYNEVEDKEFDFTSEEHEKLENLAKEVRKARNLFINSTADSLSYKYEVTCLRSALIGNEFQKLRKNLKQKIFLNLM